MYCCFGPRPYPKGFEQKNLDRSASEVRRVYANLQKLPPQYQSRTAGRIIVVAALFFGVVCAVMAANGLLTASPQDVSIWLQNVNWIPVGIGAGAFVVLSIGAGIVIHRVKSLPNELTKSGIGNISGHTHWEEAYYTLDDDYTRYDDHVPFHPGYIDTSTLDENRTGTALFYTEKGFLKNNLISIMIAGTSPLRAAAVIAYHVARLVVIPFYILGCLARDRVWSAPHLNRTTFPAPKT